MTVRLILVVGLLCVVSFFTKDAASEIPTDVGKSILSCPSGFVPAKAINVTAFSNSTSRPECICGQWGEHVHCNSETQEAFLQMTACMTYDANNNKVSVGHCHQGFYHSELRAFFLHLPPNITEVNQFMCGLYNREGFLCGRCKHGYGTAPFAKNFICKPCDGGPYVNWIKYIFAEFGPVTLLFIVMMFLQISVTSAFFNAFVFFAQIFMQPVGYRLAFTVLTTHTKGSTEALRRFVDALEMVYGVWNLEFFRPYIPPFCLVEGMSALQVVALEYITVFYPLMLIALSYILVQAHDWGFKPVRWCWKPFHACFARFRRSLDRSKCFHQQCLCNISASVLYQAYFHIFQPDSFQTLCNFVILSRL